MVSHSNREAINSSSKYTSINQSMMTKCGSSSSSRTPLQPILQHGLTAGQIGAPAPKPVRIERSTSNAPPPQKEYIQAQSAGHG
jgi:hypothetical protein